MLQVLSVAIAQVDAVLLLTGTTVLSPIQAYPSILIIQIQARSSVQQLTQHAQTFYVMAEIFYVIRTPL
jgi:hypothetical protein